MGRSVFDTTGNSHALQKHLSLTDESPYQRTWYVLRDTNFPVL